MEVNRTHLSLGNKEATEISCSSTTEIPGFGDNIDASSPAVLEGCY